MSKGDGLKGSEYVTFVGRVLLITFKSLTRVPSKETVGKIGILHRKRGTYVTSTKHGKWTTTPVPCLMEKHTPTSFFFNSVNTDRGG